MTDYTPALNNYSAMRKFGNNRWILYSVKAGRKIILFRVLLRSLKIKLALSELQIS